MNSVSGSELRHAMRRLPSPVTVVTSALAGEMRGITIGSFTSVSLDPALVSFNLSIDTPMLPMIRQASRFVVHFLKKDQAHLSETFAIPNVSGEEQFADVLVHRSPDGLPILEGVLARMLCDVHALHPSGDHVLVIGRVLEIEELDPGDPLVYFNRGYHSVGDVVELDVGSDSSPASTGTS